MVTIGFLGLGVMGFPMAQHLASAGHPLTVYDINRTAADRLRDTRPDIVIAASPAEVAAAAEVVVTMLP
ncbi:MAG TPA: NAD(P)-binding domain-containing protein, partial [Acetobacteraceae bacterium]|nr:NAD(P)-binding domain-containing protein [Acetobacteraceae bacterium]